MKIKSTKKVDEHSLNKLIDTFVKVVNTSILTETQLSEELEKGYSDMTEGRTKPSSKVFSDIRRDYKV